MAYWDSKNNKIVIHNPYPSDDYPAWDVLDCGCCNGLRWGGEEPIECDICHGGACIFRHRKTGVLALYPGGPFIGRDPKPKIKIEEVKK